MPTDDELRMIAKLTINAGTSIISKSGNIITLDLIQGMKKLAPGINHIYGVTKYYNSSIEGIIFVSITENQLNLICKEAIKLGKKGTKDPRTIYNLKTIFIGVDKSEDESLSQVTNASKIIYGGLDKEA